MKKINSSNINFKSKKLQLKKLNQSKFIKNTLFKVPTPNGFQSFKGFLKSKDRKSIYRSTIS